MSGIEVIIENLSTHPKCIHGPTLLFSRKIENKSRYYYACSACRDRKKCSFFIWKDELEHYVNRKEDKKIIEHQNSINHRLLFLKFNKMKALPEDKRIYCHTCSELDLKENCDNHKDHEINLGVSDYLLEHPSKLCKPLEDSKKEAQYLFSQKCVENFMQILKNLKYKNIICLGTPRIFEYLNSDISLGMNAILLDFDKRFHTFFGPLQFCWFNIFNNHFFKDEGKNVFNEFLKSTKKSDTILITDPPFGGRIEPIADTLNKFNNKFKKIHKADISLPVFWIFPYFMESHILNQFENYNMLDFKVDYENHPLFHKGDKGRKYGSPVRIFTNLSPDSIVLPKEEGYKFCKICKKWTSKENKHCIECNICTSKDGRTYVHCKLCKKCVKPSWLHCSKCEKCAQKNHSCEEFPFKKSCFHCKEEGHKKSECPKVDHEELNKKRKLGFKTKTTKRKMKK